MSADRDGALVEAEGLAVGYGGGAAIAEVGFSLRGGERMALLGPNGGGKTTLLRALLGELRPMRGTLRVGARCATVPPASTRQHGGCASSSSTSSSLERPRQSSLDETSYERLAVDTLVAATAPADSP